MQQAAEWLRMVQNPDGGWGESCDSYDDPNTKGQGPEHSFTDRMGHHGPVGGKRHA